MNRKAQETIYCSSVCKAWCCRNIVVHYDLNENTKPIDDEQFFKLRNITVNKKDSTLVVPSKCNWLNNQNKCKLYAWRPKACQSFRCEQLNTIIANTDA